MYNAQQFAGRGGSGGGGMRGGGQSSPGSTDRQGGANAGGARRVTQPIRPVTIKQVLNANHVGEGAIVIDGREASQVTVAGRVMAYENAAGASGGFTAKHFGYYITDGTGTVLVRQWIDQQDQKDGGSSPLPLLAIVRASGTLKIWNDLPLLTGSVRLVADSNEITFHLLDSILTHLRITKGPIPLMKQHQSSSTSSANPYGSHAATAPAVGGSVVDVVMMSVKNAHSGQGITIDAVAESAARHGFNLQQVRQTMKHLANEGKIYLVDNDHYCV